MALSYTTYYAIPRLDSYTSALARYNDTKPIRGDDNNLRPLGKRNQKWRNIKQLKDGSIAIFEGIHTDDPNTAYTMFPLILFTPSNEMHIYDTAWWNKGTTNEVITRVTGLHVKTENSKAWIRYDGGEAPLRQAPKPQWVRTKDGQGQWTYPQGTSAKRHPPSIFRKNERGNWVYVNAPGVIVHTVSRTGAKRVRERYAAGLSYVEALAKLRRDDAPKWQEITGAFPEHNWVENELKYNWYGRSKLPAITDKHNFKLAHALTLTHLLASDDPAHQYKAYLWLHRDASPAKVVDNARAVLMVAHADEWFKQCEVPAGKKAHDRYKWVMDIRGRE